MNSIDTFRSSLRSEESPPSTALARGLGWFSVALGAAEIAIPRLLAKGIGIDHRGIAPHVIRAMGAREVSAGLNILVQPRSSVPLWMRVAGDAIDLALLGLAGRNRKSTARFAAALAAVCGVTVLDVLASVRAHKAATHANRPVIYSVTINKSPMAVYQFFRDFSRLPEFMDYLEKVDELDKRRSRWVAKAPIHVTWEAEIVEDIPGEVIAWRSVEGSRVKTRGRVTFAKQPGTEATEVRVEMELGASFIGPSAALAKRWSTPQIKGDLRRLKQVLETGEVLFSDATVTKRPHSAQPSEPDVIAKNPHIDTELIRPIGNGHNKREVVR